MIINKPKQMEQYLKLYPSHHLDHNKMILLQSGERARIIGYINNIYNSLTNFIHHPHTIIYMCDCKVVNSVLDNRYIAYMIKTYKLKVYKTLYGFIYYSSRQLSNVRKLASKIRKLEQTTYKHLNFIPTRDFIFDVYKARYAPNPIVFLGP